MSSPSGSSLQKILSAALLLFSRHGFQRTSMADVAREAAIARATLYLRFPDKRALFQQLAASLVDEALAGAEAAWRDDSLMSANITAMLLAKDLRFFHLLNATPHGAEMLEIDAALTAAHVARLDAGMIEALKQRGATLEAKGADLSVFGGTEGFATFLALAGAGLKHEARTEKEFCEAIGRLGRVAARAAGSE